MHASVLANSGWSSTKEACSYWSPCFAMETALQSRSHLSGNHVSNTQSLQPACVALDCMRFCPLCPAFQPAVNPAFTVLCADAMPPGLASTILHQCASCQSAFPFRILYVYLLAQSTPPFVQTSAQNVQTHSTALTLSLSNCTGCCLCRRPQHRPMGIRPPHSPCRTDQ